jgi:hypothetical protein
LRNLLSARFNSTLVRLKVISFSFRPVIFRFQFHAGSIKRFSILISFPGLPGFNSTLVRLKVIVALLVAGLLLGFNSTLVRLKDEPSKIEIVHIGVNVEKYFRVIHHGVQPANVDAIRKRQAQFIHPVTIAVLVATPSIFIAKHRESGDRPLSVARRFDEIIACHISFPCLSFATIGNSLMVDVITQ